MKYSFEVEKNPKAKIFKQIKNELISHNTKSSAISQSANVALKEFSSEGELIGGAIAWQWGGCLEIEYLWITENARGNNLGTELILKLETLLNGHPGRSTGYPALPPQVGSKAGAVLESPSPAPASSNPACGFPTLGLLC